MAEELRGREVDCLILNAGAYSIPRHKCSTGYDNVFQINFLSPYYLARALEKTGAKIVVVGSIAHDYSKSDPADVDFSTRRAASKVYGNAKRYLMFSLMGLDCVTITHPGIAVTNITSHYPRLVWALIKYPMRLIFMKPDKACLSVLAGIFSQGGEYQWIGPRIFNIWGMPKKQRLRSYRKKEAEEIRKRAEDILAKIT